MTTEQKELFQDAVLRVLDANQTRYGLGIPAIAHLITPFGFSRAGFPSEEAFHSGIADALQYWTDKHFAEQVSRPAHRGNRVWRITPEGIDYLDERG